MTHATCTYPNLSYLSYLVYEKCREVLTKLRVIFPKGTQWTCRQVCQRKQGGTLLVSRTPSAVHSRTLLCSTRGRQRPYEYPQRQDRPWRAKYSAPSLPIYGLCTPKLPWKHTNTAIRICYTIQPRRSLSLGYAVVGRNSIRGRLARFVSKQLPK